MADRPTSTNQKPLFIDGTKHSHYEVIDPSSRLSPHRPHPFASNPNALPRSNHGSGLFSSVRSVADRATANLAHAQPTLQSSYLNIATPIPFGASHLQLADADTFKSSEQIELEATAPRDRFYLVYLIFLIHGIGVLMPWNMFLTADSYFTEYKLAPLQPNQTESEYAKNFLSYLGITAQLPNLILNAANIFCGCGGSRKASPTVRVVGAIIITVAMFVVTVVLAILDTDSWQGGFFAVTMCTVVVINMCTGVYQNTIFGIAGQLPMKYTNAVIFGSNLSGVLSAVIMIITILASPDAQWAAIWFFVAAIIVLCIALDTFFILPFLKFYKHFMGGLTVSHRHDDSDEKLVGSEKLGGSNKQMEMDKGADSGESSEVSEVSEGSGEPISERPPYLYIFKQIWMQLLGVWLTFFVSLVCFPVLQAGIQPSDPNFFIPKNLYTPITTFLFFNLFASLGNLATEWLRKPGPRYVLIPIVFRLLFIPFFMFCNFRPELRTLPVYIDNDWAYMVAGILMALTSGYFSSLCMMYSPSLVEPKWAGTAAMISALFLVLGIISGVNFTLVVAKLTEL